MRDGRALYNEIDGYCCDWLQNLMDAGHIMPGRIDNRSIADLTPDDVAGYERVHFFAGIAGWDLALTIAGWPRGKPIWTGSCPCQPFSAAGKRKGAADERHLWPEMRRLIAARRPVCVAGEQVASKDGRVWLAGVRADLEAMAYASWSVDACSAGVGAPHIRQRIWWLAESDGRQRNRITGGERRIGDGPATGRQQGDGELERRGAVGRVADTGRPSVQRGRGSDEAHGAAVAFEGDAGQRQRSGLDAGHCGAPGRLADDERRERFAPARLLRPEVPDADGRSELGATGHPGRVADTDGGLGRHGDLQSCGQHGQQPEDSRAGGVGDTHVGARGQGCADARGRVEGSDALARAGLGGTSDALLTTGVAQPARLGDSDDARSQGRLDGPGEGGRADQRPVGSSGELGFWSRYDVVHCTDGKARRFEPGSFPLAHGVSNRVGRLRAYGNAINPWLAAEVLGAYLDGDRVFRVSKVYDVSVGSGVFG